MHYTLYSLLTQEHKPDKIVLALSKIEFSNLESDLPPQILAFQKHGLEIKWCEGNIKSYKKLIPVLKIYSDCVIVTADDDMLYPKDWLSKLYNAYKENPTYLHCHRAHRVSFDKEGNILPYNDWESHISHVLPSFLNFSTGVAGTLYPPHCFYEDVLDEQKFLSLAPHQDDFWFWAMAVLNGYKINVVEENYTEIHGLLSFTLNQEKESLWAQHNSNGANDIALQNLFKQYPKLKEIIKFDSNEYWEERYKSYAEKSVMHDLSVRGGGQLIGASGAGSYNNLAAFKAEILNEFVKEHKLQNILEFGCGDGNQLSLAQYPYYVGLDVSQTAITYVKEKFSSDKTKEFYLVDNYDFRKKKAELSLSLDVIYHLIEDGVFEEYMHNLFESSNLFVGIYASNEEKLWASHVKHRKFSAWIEQNAKEWKLYRFVPNKYPFDEKNPNHTSFADFYFYKKEK